MEGYRICEGDREGLGHWSTDFFVVWPGVFIEGFRIDIAQPSLFQIKTLQPGTCDDASFLIS